MRFGRYIVGLPSLDSDTIYGTRPSLPKRGETAEENEEVSGSEPSEADAIV